MVGDLFFLVDDVFKDYNLTELIMVIMKNIRKPKSEKQVISILKKRFGKNWSKIVVTGGIFGFFGEDEEDIYTIDDIKEWYV